MQKKKGFWASKKFGKGSLKMYTFLFLDQTLSKKYKNFKEKNL